MPELPVGAAVRRSTVPPESFTEADRRLEGLTSRLERRLLVWMARRLPPWVTPDGLTALAAVAMVGAGAGYWWSSRHPAALPGAVACLAINWLGDSLDGTLARVREQQRPRYGFYVDHVLDAAGILCLAAGLGLSPLMSLEAAMAALIAYLLLCIQVYLATYCLARFQVTFWRIGPTELRILLGAGTLWVWFRGGPLPGAPGPPPFDVAGLVAAAGMLGTFVWSAFQNGRQLYRAEPISPRRIAAS